MALDVTCPNCGATLHAPAEAAGQRVKCRKCLHRFVAPGAAPPEVPGATPDESQMLNVVDVAPPRIARPPSNPFGFDQGSDAVVVPKVGRSKGYTGRTPGQSRKKKSGSKKLLLILLAVAGVLGLGCTGVSVAAYFFVMNLANKANQAVATARTPVTSKATPTATAPTPDADKPSEAAATPPDAPVNPTPTPQTSTRPRGVPKANPGAGSRQAASKAGGLAFEALPTMPEGATRVVAPVRATVTLDCPADKVRALSFSAADPRVVAVLWRSGDGFQGAGAKDTIDIYALGNGYCVARIERDAGAGAPVFAVSPDGAHVAVADGKVTAFSVQTKKAVVDRAEGTPPLLFFPDDGHLAGIDHGLRGQVWELATGAATRVNAEGTGGRAFSGAAAGSGYFAEPGALRKLSLKPASFGKPEAESTLPMPPGFDRPRLLATDAKARGVVALSDAAFPGAAFALTAVNPPAAPLTVSFPKACGLPVEVAFVVGDGVVAIVGPDRATATLFDLEARVAVAHLAQPKRPTRVYADAAGRQLWWLQADAADAKKAKLLAASADFDDYQATLAEAKAAQRPVPLVLTAGGFER